MHVALSALASKAWLVLWFGLAGLGLIRNDTDEGTFLLSLSLPVLANDSTGVVTSVASFGTS